MDDALFAGLKALEVGAFPKVCHTCGRVYETLEQFLEDTSPISSTVSGLKESLGDNDSPQIELYRNCRCGSTLMDFCTSRRDHSEQGRRRREIFADMLERLVLRGISWEIARRELLLVSNGNRSKLLDELIHNRN